jgi:hypothetical protein
MKVISKFVNAILLSAATIMIFSSCDDNKVDPFGSANLKVVNAAPNSGSQKFIMANIPFISNLGYLDHSVSYLKVTSGNNLITEYRDNSNYDLYASEKLNLDDEKTYTVYLTGESQNEAKIRMYQDDLSEPASGKAKVKFIHLSGGAPSMIDLSDVNGNLTTSLGQYNQSSYVEINAGSHLIKAHAAGQSETVATLESTEFLAGKIYTVYLLGSTTSNLSIHTLIHN